MGNRPTLTIKFFEKYCIDERDTNSDVGVSFCLGRTMIYTDYIGETGFQLLREWLLRKMPILIQEFLLVCHIIEIMCCLLMRYTSILFPLGRCLLYVEVKIMIFNVLLREYFQNKTFKSTFSGKLFGLKAILW